MTIKKIDRLFYPKVKHKTWFCRNCCNTFYSEKSIMNIDYFVNQMKL